MLGKIVEAKTQGEGAAFHLTVTENATGKVLVDKDTSCIIGSYDNNDETTAAMGFTKCNTIDLVATVKGAITAIEQTTKNNPIALLFVMQEFSKIAGR